MASNTELVDESNDNPSLTESIDLKGLKIKEEFNRSIQILIDKLVEKREEVFKKIDGIVKQTSEDMKKKENEMGEIFQTRRKLSTSKMKGSDADKKLIESLDNEIVGLKIPTVKIKWNHSLKQLIENISQLVDVEECYKTSYNLKENPIWTGVTQGKSETELLKPGGLAVDPETNEIYVGDRGAPKILVFNQNGKQKRSLDVKTKHNMVSRMCIFQNSIFFISEVLQTPLYKVRKDNGDRIVKQTYSRKLNRLTVDYNGNIFMCNDSEMYLYSCNTHLGNNNQTKLYSPYLKGNIMHVTRLLDIQVLVKEVYCLFNNTEMPIQVFTRRGELIRPIRFSPTPLRINTSLVNMHIDKDENILVHFGVQGGGISVYNAEGVFITEIGKLGKDRGEMIEPRGIVVVGANQALVVCNANPLNMLVAY